MALTMLTVLIPLTLGVAAIADLAWTYHALVTLTRQGANYAATHCFEDDSGTNVMNWMAQNAPPFLDKPQLLGSVQIQVNYWAHDLTNHQSTAYSCGAACTPECVPDSVTVSISNYQFARWLGLIHLQPLQMPSFATTVEVQSAGGDPEQGISLQ